MSSFVPTGTRVIVIRGGARRSGVVTDVRWETYLRPYVVRCDDGAEVFVSACDLAREDDPAATPLGPAIER